MESLALILEPYQDIVGKIATIVTIGQMFSGSFLCLDIYKNGSTKGIDITPFACGISISLLNFKYGIILRDDNIIRVSVVGGAINIVYLMVYLRYTDDMGKFWTSVGLSVAVSAVILGYAQYEDPKLVEDRLGIIITLFIFYLIASPLLGLRTIIANQSTEGMPFPIILSGTVVSTMWLLYGIILRNQFMVLQNLVALFLGASQLALFVIYPSKPKGKERKPVAKKVD